MDNVQRYLQNGGTIRHIPPGVTGPPIPRPRIIRPTERAKQIPSAKSCRHCQQYSRGTGTHKCLRCKNYKLLDRIFDLRDTISIIPMVSELIEAFPAPPRPDNTLMAIIRQLPAHHAAIISMHYYAALSVREIAVVMQITQPAANTKLYRAVKVLRKIILLKYPNVKTRKDALLS
jgi:hypothetical protein